MDWLLDHWDEIVLAIGALIIVARIIVRLTPTQRDDNVLAKVTRLLTKIGLHVPEEKARSGK